MCAVFKKKNYLFIYFLILRIYPTKNNNMNVGLVIYMYIYLYMCMYMCINNLPNG